MSVPIKEASFHSLSLDSSPFIGVQWWLANLVLTGQDVFVSYCFSNDVDIVKKGKVTSGIQYSCYDPETTQPKPS